MSVQTSVYTGILRVVQAKIVALNLPGIKAVTRRKIALVAADDDLPIIIVSPEKEKVFAQDVKKNIVLDYPVLVTTAFAGDQLVEKKLDDLLDWREAIRFELNVVTLSGVPSVIDCNIDLEPAFDFPRYRSELDVSAIRFTYRSSESWNR